MTLVCQVCDLPALYVIEYATMTASMHSTPFCSAHAAELSRAIHPLTDKNVRTFSRQMIGRERVSR